MSVNQQADSVIHLNLRDRIVVIWSNIVCLSEWKYDENTCNVTVSSKKYYILTKVCEKWENNEIQYRTMSGS